MERKKVSRQAGGPAEQAGAGSIHARVIDEEKGLRLITGVSVVRVRSKGYNLLIMEDYLPALGKVDGSVTFLTRDEEYHLDGVKGFYKHQHNEFTLLLEKQASAVVTPSGSGEGGEAG